LEGRGRRVEEGEGLNASGRRMLAAGALLAVAIAAGAGAYPTTTNDSAAAVTRTFRFTYSIAVRHIPTRTHRISIWVPEPQTDPHQKVLDLVAKATLEYSFPRERRYGTRLLHLDAQAPLPDSIQLEVEAVVSRQAYRALDSKTGPGNDRPGARDLSPDALVPTDGEIASVAKRATAGARTPLEKARAIYEYGTSTMKYDKSGEGWGRGDRLRP